MYYSCKNRIRLKFCDSKVVYFIPPTFPIPLPPACIPQLTRSPTFPCISRKSDARKQILQAAPGCGLASN